MAAKFAETWATSGWTRRRSRRTPRRSLTFSRSSARGALRAADRCLGQGAAQLTPRPFSYSNARGARSQGKDLKILFNAVFRSYGSVYKALHKDSGKVVAIKQVPVDSDLQVRTALGPRSQFTFKIKYLSLE